MKTFVLKLESELTSDYINILGEVRLYLSKNLEELDALTVIVVE